MSLENEFIKYEQALELKELGFNEPCFGLYAPPSKTVFLHHYGLLSAKEQILAPLYQQSFRWFREKYGYLHHITYFDPFKAQIPGEADYQGLVLFPHQEVHKLAKVSYDTYEEAELACLEKLIEIVESKKEK